MLFTIRTTAVADQSAATIQTKFQEWNRRVADL